MQGNGSKERLVTCYSAFIPGRISPQHFSSEFYKRIEIWRKFPLVVLIELVPHGKKILFGSDICDWTSLGRYEIAISACSKCSHWIECKTCVLLIQIAHHTVNIKTRRVFVPNCYFFNIESKLHMKFSDAHHLVWSKLVLSGLDVSHHSEKSYANKTS